MMALEGHGVAFLPESAVLRELRSRQLARAGDPALMVEMDIRVYRERPTAARPGKAVADRLWQHLARLPGAGAPPGLRPSQPAPAAQAATAARPAPASTPATSPRRSPHRR